MALYYLFLFQHLNLNKCIQLPGSITKEKKTIFFFNCNWVSSQGIRLMIKSEKKQLLKENWKVAANKYCVYNYAKNIYIY